MVPMERTEKERERDDLGASKESDKKPMYGYGTRLTLEDAELKKLGVDELPEVGDEFHIAAVGEVIAVRNNAFEDGREEKCVEVQITHMGAIHEDAEEDDRKPGEVLYGRHEDENAE